MAAMLAFVEWEKAREAAVELAQRDEQERVAALEYSGNVVWRTVNQFLRR
jgi:hypothetical protein